MVVLNFLNDQLLKMKWLHDLVRLLVEKVFRLSIEDRIGNSIHFFIYDTIKIFILLSVLIFTISYIQSHFPPERTKKILGKFKGLKANAMGALLGTVTPFCSCSSIPLFIGFTNSGLPIGVTFSFLISSPLVDLASVILLASIFNIKVALAYVVVGIILAIIGGTIIEKFGLEKYIEPYVFQTQSMQMQQQLEQTRKDRIRFSTSQVKFIVKKVWLYILVGVGIGTLIHNWIPQSFTQAILGKQNFFSVIIATFVGIPMYADIFGTIPIAEALLTKGVGLGTVLAFMMAVVTLSLPSIILLKKVVKPKLLVIFVAIVTIGILIIGYSFNYIGQFLI